MNTRRIRTLVAAAVCTCLFMGLGATAFAQGGAENLKVDPVHSNVLFRVQHFGAGYVFGEFLDKKGTIKFDAEHPEKSTFAIEVATNSIETHNEKRDEHLRSSSFFDAKQFPTMTFKSTSVKKRTDDTLEVQGELSFHGQTKPVTALVLITGSSTDPQGKFRRGFYTTINIKRSDFGVNYLPGAVSDEVKLIIATEAVRQ